MKTDPELKEVEDTLNGDAGTLADKLAEACDGARTAAVVLGCMSVAATAASTLPPEARDALLFQVIPQFLKVATGAESVTTTVQRFPAEVDPASVAPAPSTVQ